MGDIGKVNTGAVCCAKCMDQEWVFQELQKEDYTHQPPTGRLRTALHLIRLPQQVGILQTPIIGIAFRRSSPKGQGQ